MKDRVVQYPNRYKVTPVAGQDATYDLQAQPGTVTEPGTTLNKAALLSDETARMFDLRGEGATVSNALGRANLSSYQAFCANVNAESINIALGKRNENYISGVGRQLAMYAWFRGADKVQNPFINLVKCNSKDDIRGNVAAMEEIKSDKNLYSLCKKSSYFMLNVDDFYTIPLPFSAANDVIRMFKGRFYAIQDSTVRVANNIEDLKNGSWGVAPSYNIANGILTQFGDDVLWHHGGDSTVGRYTVDGINWIVKEWIYNLNGYNIKPLKWKNAWYYKAGATLLCKTSDGINHISLGDISNGGNPTYLILQNNNLYALYSKNGGGSTAYGMSLEKVMEDDTLKIVYSRIEVVGLEGGSFKILDLQNGKINLLNNQKLVSSNNLENINSYEAPFTLANPASNIQVLRFGQGFAFASHYSYAPHASLEAGLDVLDLNDRSATDITLNCSSVAEPLRISQRELLLIPDVEPGLRIIKFMGDWS